MSSVGGVNRNQHVTLDVNLTEIGPSDRGAALQNLVEDTNIIVFI